MLTQAFPGPVNLSPSHILQTGLGCWSSRILATAVSLDLFTLLADGSRSAKEISRALEIRLPDAIVFLDALVALRFLVRRGRGEAAFYDNTVETDTYLDRNKDTYIGSMIAEANSHLQPGWESLESNLRGRPGSSPVSRQTVKTFEMIFNAPEKLEDFLLQQQGIIKEHFGAGSVHLEHCYS